MKKRRLSILLSIVMLFSLLPTTALAADYPDPASVSVDGSKSFSTSQLYYKNNDAAGSFSGSDTGYNAHYDPATGTLTLNGYEGGQIKLGGDIKRDLTIKLIGDNKITVTGDVGIVVNSYECNITITAESGSSGKLTINVTNEASANDGVTGIGNYLATGGGTSGNVTITGYADVTINATSNTTNYTSYGIYAGEVIIKDHAKAAIIVKAPSNTGGDFVYGIFAKTNVTINTAGEITVDASNAGTGGYVYSTGVNSQGNLTLTKVGKMTVKWNSNLSSQGSPLYPVEEFDPAAYDNIVDKTNCIATYTPKVATANIRLDKTGTVDFGSREAGYTTAPTAETVTITNSGTAATGQLTIALDGTNKTDFTLSKDNISNIAASGTDTFTVQPKTELSADTYTATVKVSGTGAGVTEQSFDVKFTVTAPLTPIAVPTANSETYDGTKKTGVSGGTGYSLGGICEAIDVGATGYTATATLDSGYKWNDGSTDDKTITWNIGKRTPIATDFTVVLPTDLTYNGNNKTASVTLNSPLSKSGAINVKYEKSGSDVTETKDVGKYTVKIDVGGGENFEAASGLTASAWTFSITPAEWGTPTETLTPVNPTATGGNDGQITGTTSDMQYKKSDGTWTDCTGNVTGLTAGTYYVRYKADGNHTASDTNYKTVTLTDPGATRYSVTVTDGTADPTGDQAAGTEVTITATTKKGFNFKEWTGLNVSDYKTGFTKTSNPATFTMPASNVNVTATYDPATLTGTASITGNLKYDQELTASLAGDNNTGTLTYTWYRSGETTAIATDNTGKYTLVEDDIGKIITVEITSSDQTGKINGSTTGTIEKADGPAAPSAFTLSFTLNSDGKTFTATIPTVVGGEYSFDGSTYSPTNTKNNCTANTTYNGYARVKETATHKASTATNSTQTAPKLTVATPTFTPNGVSSFSGTQSVTITCNTADAKIYYTTNGTDPTTASGIEYKTALTLTSTTTLKAIAVKADMNDSAIATATFTKASGGSSGGGSSYVPKTQKPEIKAAAGGKTVLSKDGTTLTITADAGKVIDKVLLNGKDMGAVSELKGLKTGDKVEVTFKDQVTEPTKEQLDKAAKEAAGELVLAARSAKLKNGSVKVMLKDDLKAITDAGYTVKYKFYRSTKKSAGYKAVLTKKAPTYVNTYGKQGTMYYYKARVMVYDKDGNFVAQTALKQCKYANRLWTK